MRWMSTLAFLLLVPAEASSLKFAAISDPSASNHQASNPVAVNRHVEQLRPLQLVAQLAADDDRSDWDDALSTTTTSSSSSSTSSSSSSRGAGARPYRIHRVRPTARKLLGSSSNVIQVAYSNVYSSNSTICPSGGAGTIWDPITNFGHLVSDNWVCSNPARPEKVHGGSAQDYVSLPNWETYGWAAFSIPAAPAGSPEPKARLEGLNLHVLGSVGLGSSGTCRVQAVDIAIFSDISGAPSADLYNARLLLPGNNSGSQTFTWSSNTSRALSFDILSRHGVDGTVNPPAVLLDFSKQYWLRVKMEVPFGGDSGTAKCYISWALNNVSKTGSNCLWQEAQGGAFGYSTTCTGAANRAVPAPTQTFATCFNGGLSGSAAVRRCLTYRSTVSTPVTCPAQFLDFNFAFYGNNAAKCGSVPSPNPGNATWPGACANTPVGQNCNATCNAGFKPTSGGAPTVTCLVTGAWSTSVTGACEVVTCAGVPTPKPDYCNWPAECANTTAGQNCTAVCAGTVSGTAPTAECLNTGEWSASTGACPAACAGNPTADVTNGNWDSSDCSGKAVGDNCPAGCNANFVPDPVGGGPTVTCLVTGNWGTSITGACVDGCAAVPTASVPNGNWPGTCANTPEGQTCTATCDNGAGAGGLPTVECTNSGAWSTSVTGSCAPL